MIDFIEPTAMPNDNDQQNDKRSGSSPAICQACEVEFTPKRSDQLYSTAQGAARGMPRGAIAPSKTESALKITMNVPPV